MQERQKPKRFWEIFLAWPRIANCHNAQGKPDLIHSHLCRTVNHHVNSILSTLRYSLLLSMENFTRPQPSIPPVVVPKCFIKHMCFIVLYFHSHAVFSLEIAKKCFFVLYFLKNVLYFCKLFKWVEFLFQVFIYNTKIVEL